MEIGRRTLDFGEKTLFQVSVRARTYDNGWGNVINKKICRKCPKYVINRGGDDENPVMMLYATCIMRMATRKTLCESNNMIGNFNTNERPPDWLGKRARA